MGCTFKEQLLPRDGKIGACPLGILLLERGISQVITGYLSVLTKKWPCVCVRWFLDWSLVWWLLASAVCWCMQACV